MSQVIDVPVSDFRPDPHAGFARYRSKHRAIRINGSPLIFTRYQDAEDLMCSRNTLQMEMQQTAMKGVTGGALQRLYDNTMLTSNDPEHRRRRRPISKGLSYKLMEIWRPHIREIVLELIDQLKDQHQCDFMRDIAAPIPARVIAAFLGASGKDAYHFQRLSYEVTRSLSLFKEDELEEIDCAASELIDYVADLLDQRRREPTEDFLTSYLELVEESGDLSEDEVLMQIVALVIGGADTSRFILTTMVSELLRSREQWEALCSNSQLAENAVLEALRYEPVAGSIGLTAIEQMDFKDFSIESGENFIVSLLSAQRDETIYTRPESFNIHRKDHPRRSLSFGAGPHRCVGEALARVELEETLKLICETLPDLKLAEHPATIVGNMGMRRVSPLPVSW